MSNLTRQRGLLEESSYRRKQSQRLRRAPGAYEVAVGEGDSVTLVVFARTEAPSGWKLVLPVRSITRVWDQTRYRTTIRGV